MKKRLSAEQVAKRLIEKVRTFMNVYNIELKKVGIIYLKKCNTRKIYLESNEEIYLNDLNIDELRNVIEDCKNFLY